MCLQVTLQIAKLLEGPVAVRTLKGTLLCICICPAAAFLHGNQKSSDLVIVVVFECLSDRMVGTSFLFTLGGGFITPLLKTP